MIKLVVFVIWFSLILWSVIKSNKAHGWHRGVGERKGKAEYSRIKRENPDSSDAQLGEAEFVDKFVSSSPGVARYIIITALTFIIGGPIVFLTIISSL